MPGLMKVIPRSCKALLPAIIAGLMSFTACWDAVTLPEEDGVDPFFIADTLSHTLDDGLFITFSSYRKSYTLDEHINFKMRAENRSLEPYVYSFLARPFSFQKIEDEFGANVPLFRVVIPSEGTSSIAPGDSLVEGGIWGQRGMLGDGSTGFKVFAGWYRLRSYITVIKGSSFVDTSLAQYPVTRWVRIGEEGEPMGMLVRRINRQSDSLQIAIGLRNRISKAVGYQYAPNNSLQMVCTQRQGGDTLFAARQSLGNSRLVMSAFTDSTFFTFSRSLNDSVFNGASGSFDVKARST